MAKKFYRSFSTELFELSVANEDVLKRLYTANGWESGTAKKTEVYTKGDLVLEINGYRKALLAGSELQIDELVDSFITITADVEFYVTFEF